MPFAQGLSKLGEMDKAKSGKSMLIMPDNVFKAFSTLCMRLTRA